MEYNAKKIGERIREIREYRKFSQEFAAEKCNCSQSTIFKYEKGAGQITAEMLFNISIGLDVSVDYLLGLSDIQQIQQNN